MSSSEASESENEDPGTIVKFRKSAKRKFTRLVSTIKSHIEKGEESAGIRVHRSNLVELYDECLRLQTRYVNKAVPTGEALIKTQKWCQDLDVVYRNTVEILDQYLGELEEDEDIGDPGDEVNSVQKLELELQQSTQKLADDLEDARLAEARKAEDIKRRAVREQHMLERRIAIARAQRGNGPLTSTTLEGGSRDQSNVSFKNNSQKRSYSSMTTKINNVSKKETINQAVDAWIYEPFPAVNVNRDGQTLVSLSMIPNLKPFAGDPREWPMFVQAFKAMVHDVFESDAQRLSMLHSMLGEKLRTGMSQILSSPTAYRQALQELRRKYGHPHLVVRTYIQGLMEMAPFRGGDALEDFSTQLHGAVATLEAAGYGHELDSSVALEGLVRKLPDGLISRWGRQVNRLLPNIPTLRDLDEWLEDEVMSEKNVRRFDVNPTKTQRNKPSSLRDLQRNQTPLIPTINAIDGSQGKVAAGGRCALCENEPGHSLSACQKFASMTPTKRAQAVWELRNCFRCLGRNHHSNECKKIDTVCSVNGCSGKHHTLLHGADSVVPNNRNFRDQGR